MTSATILIVPGLRDHVHDHWQTWLATRLESARLVPPMGREDLDLSARVGAVERAARACAWPVIVVAHSAGVITVAHWAQQTSCHVVGALLAVPPDLERPMPKGYPTVQGLRRGGWLPVPREPLPFPSIVAGSRNDPLASLKRVTQLANAWRSRLVDLGDVGHLNPASGYGEWPFALQLIEQLVDPRGAVRSPDGATFNRADTPSARHSES
jgi:predicted alpha/beta hydrolase family esterase